MKLSDSARLLAGSVRRKGIRGTARRVDHLWRARHTERARREADRLFDVEHGVETAALVRVHDLDADSPNRQFARRYQASHVDVFTRLIGQLPDDLRSFVFVDIGCGKGRALLLAAHHPFARVVGVEFAPSLLRIARENLRRVGLSGDRVELVLADAEHYDLPQDPLVVYFFNPFTADLLARVLERANASLQHLPRPMFIVLVGPHPLADAVTSAGFVPVEVEEHGPMTHGVYSALLPT